MKEPEILESRPLVMRMQMIDPEDPKQTTPRREVQGTFTVFKTRESTPAK